MSANKTITWQEVALGDIAEVRGGKRLPLGSDLTTTPNSHPYIRVRDLNNGKIADDLLFVPDEVFPEISRYIVNTGDIVLSIVGTIGMVARIGKGHDNASLTENCVKIRPSSDDLDRNFLFYYLLSRKGQGEIAKNTIGAVQAKLPIYGINNIILPLPDAVTQRTIATVLSSLDDKIELLQKQNETLEEVAQAIFKEWFVNFNFPNEEGKPYRDSGGKMVDSELGEIPEGWEVKKLKELVEIKRGGSPRPIQEYLSNEGLRWLKISDATATSSPYIFDIKEHIKNEGLNKTVLLKKGSLVLSNSATPGIPKFLAVDSCIHDGWLHFPNIQTLSYEYLFFLFKEIKENLIQQGNGSVFTNLKTDILKEYPVVVAKDPYLAKYNGFIKSIFQKIYANEEQNTGLVLLRDILLQKLMSGEVRVNR